MKVTMEMNNAIGLQFRFVQEVVKTNIRKGSGFISVVQYVSKEKCFN